MQISVVDGRRDAIRRLLLLMALILYLVMCWTVDGGGGLVIQKCWGDSSKV